MYCELNRPDPDSTDGRAWADLNQLRVALNDVHADIVQFEDDK